MALSSALYDLARVYFACRDTDTLLKTFAARLGAALEARAVLVWLMSEAEEGFICRARWSEPGERLTPASELVGEGLLAEVAQSEQGRRLASREIKPEELIHLEEGSRARIRTALYGVLPGTAGAAGVVEVLNKRSGEFTADDAGFLGEASQITGAALAQMTAIDRERHSQLSTLERLTSLYDLSRIFNSTLELGELLPIVASKVRDLLGAQACNLWLMDPDEGDLYLAQQDGEDPTLEEGARAPLKEGLLGEMAQKGSARLVEDPEGETSLADRRKAAGDFKIEAWMGAPLRKEGEVMGILELVNKPDSTPFSEDDLFFLSSVSEQAAVALHNANLLESERKVHALDALLKISREITSTLDLDRVLTTVVHQAARVVPSDRCIIGFFDRDRFVLGAVSGEAEVPKSPEMNQLRAILAWAAEQSEPVAADQYDEGWQVSPEQARAQLVGTLEEQGFSGFYALPLRDDQGTLGALALLSGDAEFLTKQHRETLNILANQTTVAIRNARLYQQVPLVSLLKPFAEKKRKLEAISRSRWVEIGWKAAIVVLLLTLVPWRMRVESYATVVPAERRAASAEVRGIIQRVSVHEGDTVARGQLLAQLDDSDFQAQLAAAQANLALARRDLSDAEFRRDLAAATQAHLRMQMHQAEVALYQEKVAKARLRAPIAGVVVTPKVEEKVGTLLSPGDQFCELMGQDQMAAEMNVPETDFALISPGKHVALKLNAFSTFTYNGTVERVAARTISAEGDQFFLVRARFNNSNDHRARDGMVGRAKITARGGWWDTGWYPVGYVLFRSVLLWVWQKAWTWLP